MRIGAAGAKRTHAGPPRMGATALPFLQRRLNIEWRLCEIDVRICGAIVQGGDQLLMLHLQQHLRDCRDPCSGLEMSDIRFHRADRANLLLPGDGFERFREPGDLDGVSQRGAGSVSLDVTHCARIDGASLERLHDQFRLDVRIGNTVAVRLTSMVDSARLDHRMDLILVPERILQGFQEHGPDAFSGHITVSTRSEAPAPAVGGEVFPLTQAQILLRVD